MSGQVGSGGVVPGKVTIAAHHYQRPDIVARAGLVGDSYRLAVESARTDAEFVVLCGVRFMAESAAILAREGQTVVIPDMNAGCPMADMIDRETAENAVETLSARLGRAVVPIAYMNSSAEVKALAGRLGGSVCTSGNARKILAHYLDQQMPVFFLPDFNLGMNVSRALGVSRDGIRRVTRGLSVARLDSPEGCAPDRDRAGRPGDDSDLSRARVFLWDGFCHVHRAFTADDVRAARKARPDAFVIVHPECSAEVTSLADRSGSTEEMSHALRDAKPGSSWVIGTEGRFVERMAATYPNLTIAPLRASYCHNMNRIDGAALDKALADIAAHCAAREDSRGGARISGTVTVPPDVREDAARALRAMVSITESGGER